MSRGHLERVKRNLTLNPSDQPVELEQPINIVDFATNPKFLGKSLYPEQATILKVMALEIDAFTDFDREVIDGWTAGFTVADAHSDAWQGTKGTPGDLMDRIRWCIDAGYPWFREVLLLIGRRGGKNFLATIFAAWRLWQLCTGPDPHLEFGIDPLKRLTCLVLAGKKDQAIRNQLRDISEIVTTALCFKPLHPTATRDSLVLFTRAQIQRGRHRAGPDAALIEIRAVETTQLGVRGPAVPMLMFDEFAHLRGAGPTADSVELYDAALPATEQFGVTASIVQTTSAWDRLSQAWKTYQRGCGRDPATGAATDPDYFILQLPSWAPYEHWDRVGEIPMWPGGPRFGAGRAPILEFNERLARDKAANPDTFAVEMESQWRESRFAYFPAPFAAKLFGPYQGRLLKMTERGRLGTQFFAHADPSLSQANFGASILHLEVDEDDIPHLLFDVIHHWSPRDFPDGIINYAQIEDEIFDFIKVFNITIWTFDTWNSAGSIQRLNDRVARGGLPWRTQIRQIQPTADLNWRAYEIFKTAVGHGIVHAPSYPLAEAEFRSVQLHNGKVVPADTGDTRTKDVLDAMVFAAYNAIGDRAELLFKRLSELPLRATSSAPPATHGPLSLDEEVHQKLSLPGGRPNMHSAVRGYQGQSLVRGAGPYRRGRRWYS